MKIIILSAGRGSRLGPITMNTPKALLDMGNGQTLVEKQLEEIDKSRVINEIVIVVGYLAEQIEVKIKEYNKQKITTQFNPFHETSNNLISLWLVANHMNEDFIVQNGDNIFTSDVYVDLINSNSEGIFVTTNKKSTYHDDDMKVTICNGRIEKIHKEIETNKIHAESVGLAMIKGDKYRNIFRENLEFLARNKIYTNKFWLEVFNLMSSKGIEIKPFQIDAKNRWQEIDIHLDLHQARKLMGLDQ